MILALATALLAAQNPAGPKPEDTEVWSPKVPVVTPGAYTPAPPPSDAIVLFDGKDLSQWATVHDSSPARWKVHDGIVTVDKISGNIQTRRRFGSYQLHLEWRIPADITGEGTSGWFYSVSGNIRLSGNAKSIEAETMNGSLDLNVTTPWLKARAGHGNILLRGAPEDVDASTIGGTISIATSSVLRGQFSSVAGDIHFAAAPSPHGIFEFSNHSGNVELAMPSNVSATLALSTVSGAIENGFPRVRPTTNGRQAVRLSLGGGDAQITVRTFKGAIRLRAQ